MSILDIRIGGRSHQIACDDGQEGHVRGLARELDARVRDLGSRMGGQVPDGTLLALTALMLTDELNEAREQNKNLKLQIGNASQSFEKAKQSEMELAVAAAITEIAADIENMAQSLEQAPLDKAVAKS